MNRLEKIGKTLPHLTNYGNIQIGSAIVVNAHGSNFIGPYFNSNIISIVIIRDGEEKIIYSKDILELTQNDYILTAKLKIVIGHLGLYLVLSWSNQNCISIFNLAVKI